MGVIRFCDKCGIEIDKKKYSKLQILDIDETSKHIVNEREFCTDCMNEIRRLHINDVSGFDEEFFYLCRKISKTKGITIERTAYKIRQAQKVLGVPLREYYEKGYYNYTNYHLVEILYTPTMSEYLDKMTSVVELRMGISKEKARERLINISEKFNISLRTIMRQSFFKCSDEKIKERIEWGGIEVSAVTIAKRKGCTVETAQKRLDELKNEFGITTNIGVYFDKSNDEIFHIMEQKDEKLMRGLINLARAAKLTVGEFFHRRQLIMQSFGDGKELYGGLRMARKSDEAISSFILSSDMRYLMNKYNLNKDKSILDNKAKFAEFFKDTYGRGFWCNTPGATFKSFENFLQHRKYEDLIVKPINGLCGWGIRKISLEGKDTYKLYEELMATDPAIVEECIAQHDIMAQFGKGAVNTIRILSIYENGESHIIYAVIRIGMNDVVDNFHSGGFVARIGKATGIIEGNGYTMGGKEYITDPCSNKKIEGTLLPYWDQVIELIHKSSEKLNTIGYIGWDVAISQDGPMLIEGNSNAMAGLIEFAYKDKKTGHRDLLEEFLDEKHYAS